MWRTDSALVRSRLRTDVQTHCEAFGHLMNVLLRGLALIRHSAGE